MTRPEIRCCVKCGALIGKAPDLPAPEIRGRAVAHGGASVAIPAMGTGYHIVWEPPCSQCQPPVPDVPVPVPAKLRSAADTFTDSELRNFEKILEEIHPNTHWGIRLNPARLAISMRVVLLDLITGEEAASHDGEVQLRWAQSKDNLVMAIGMEAQRMIDDAPTTLL